MSKHRAELRPRYGRFAALGAALVVTLVAVLGGAGLLPTLAGGDRPAVAAPAALDEAGRGPAPRCGRLAVGQRADECRRHRGRRPRRH